MTTHRLARGGAITAACAITGALVLLVTPSAAPDVNTLPTISGSTVKGSTLTATTGSWTGTAPISFDFRWRRCDTQGSNCADISGATDQTYVLTSNDVGKRLRVRVTASNSDGSSSALSNATATVTNTSAPTNTAEPVISGSAVEGKTLTTNNGSWSGTTPMTYAYQWVRCGSNGGKPDGSDCPTISGATSSSYVLSGSDVGRRLRVQVTATNSAGSKTVASNPTATVVASSTTGKPVNTAEPSISGTAAAGQTLTTTSGSWDGAQPISFSYRWVRCGSDGGRSDGSNCSSLKNATGQTYVPTSSDVGRRLRVRVTAKNSAGSTTVASNPTATVGSAGPSGQITLPNGEKSIPVTSVPDDERLIVDAVVFSPSPVRSRTAPITVRIRIKDTRGFVVRDARVFIRSTPLVTSSGNQRATATDGWLSYELVPRSNFPEVRGGYSIQFFVKAYRSGDPTLGGVAGTRLVQVAMSR